MGTNIHSGVGEISCDLVVLRRTRSGIQPQIKRKRTPTTDENTKTVTMNTKTVTMNTTTVTMNTTTEMTSD